MEMNKKETLRLLDKYTDALKFKAEAEDNLSKVDREFKVDTSSFDVPYTKILAPFIAAFMVFALAIRVGFSGVIKASNEIPITLGIFAGAAVIAVVISKIIHIFVQKKARKKREAYESHMQIGKDNRAAGYQNTINNMSYKIAEVESILPMSLHGLEAAKTAKNKLLRGQAETLEEVSGGYTEADWEEAYKPEPKMFSMPDGSVFGGFAISEATRTVFPKDPNVKYANSDHPTSDWRVVFVSLTHNTVLGDSDFYSTLPKLEKFILDSNEDSILLGGLNYKALEKMVENPREDEDEDISDDEEENDYLL